MRLEINDCTGVRIGTWVAKTARGFNAKQRKEIEEAKDSAKRIAQYYDRSNWFKTQAEKDNYQNALLEWMTQQ